VVVDIREDSPTRLQHYATELNSTQERSLYIPQGFAHGYQALTDNCVLLYLHFGFYEPASEDGLHPADPALAIEWPLKMDHLSARDQQHPLINSDFKGIRL
jgi:dTDP-4-dehydrorhamnose 3,5-epimerase